MLLGGTQKNKTPWRVSLDNILTLSKIIKYYKPRSGRTNAIIEDLCGRLSTYSYEKRHYLIIVPSHDAFLEYKNKIQEEMRGRVTRCIMGKIQIDDNSMITFLISRMGKVNTEYVQGMRFDEIFFDAPETFDFTKDNLVNLFYRMKPCTVQS